MISRRTFLALAALSPLALRAGDAAARSHGHAPSRRFPPPVQAVAPIERFTTPLRLPGPKGLMAELSLEHPIELSARIWPESLLPGPQSLLWSYQCETAQGIASNPVLRLRRGQSLEVRLRNRLDEDTTIHWHGLNVDERNDGSGLHPLAPGATTLYRFPVEDAAAMYWYHPHPHYRTGLQIHSGMGAPLLVEDAGDDALRAELGLEFGRTELPLMIQDKQIGEKNQLQYEIGDDDWIGNRILVNWTPEPVLQAERRLYRLRLLNAANARPFRLAFRHDRGLLDYWLIGTDAGRLDAPKRVRECFLAPAQRLDLLVDFSRLAEGSRVMLSSLAFDPMENDGAPPVDLQLEHPGASAIGEPLDVMAIDLHGPAARRAVLPARLGEPLPPLREAPTTREFRVHIDNGRWLINGINHHDDMGKPRFRVERGRYEVWEIRNDTVSMPHPMHLHAFRFRLLERIGSPSQVRQLASGRSGLTPQDSGWLDTVLVWPGERVRIGIDFSQSCRGDQTYMFHCHNLEHEDQGLMLSFVVGDPA